MHFASSTWLDASKRRRKSQEPESSNVGCEVRLVVRGALICDANKSNREMRETDCIFCLCFAIVTNIECASDNMSCKWSYGYMVRFWVYTILQACSVIATLIKRLMCDKNCFTVLSSIYQWFTICDDTCKLWYILYSRLLHETL